MSSDTQYPWPSAMTLRAAQKAIGRHERGAAGGRGGQFAKKPIDATGIKEVDHARLAHGEYNRMRVRVAKMKKVIKDAGGYENVSEDYLKAFSRNVQTEKQLQRVFDKAKSDAKNVGYKIDSRGKAKKISSQKITKVDSPHDNLAKHIELEKELLSKVVSQKVLKEGGTNSNPDGNRLESADKPLLCKLENGKTVVMKEDGYNNYSHAHSEVAVSRISALLGIGNVPVTAMKKQNGDHVSSQEFIDDSKVASVEMYEESLTFAGMFSYERTPLAKKNYRDRYKDQLNDIFILDSVTGGLDRHDGNIVQKDGKLHAIDNGRAVLGWKEIIREEEDVNVLYRQGGADSELSGTAKRYYGFEDYGMRIPVKKETLDRWKNVKKSDFELAFSGLDTDIDVDLVWNNFVGIRDNGGVMFSD